MAQPHPLEIILGTTFLHTKNNYYAAELLLVLAILILRERHLSKHFFEGMASENWDMVHEKIGKKRGRKAK